MLILVSLGIGSFSGLLMKTIASQKDKQGVIRPEDLLRSLLQRSLDRRVNILLLGSDYNYFRGKRISDEQAGVRSRTDTIMLASLDPGSHKVSILSIPRDTRALLTGYHYDKINAAMTYGGVDLVKSTVQDLTGVPIDYYMALKVDGLVNTVDILGGIRMYVEKDMRYQDDTAHLGINIHKGWKEHMNGEQAHGYIRFRHDELGDIGRVQRQQKFIHAVLDKLLQPASWFKLPALIDHLNENIETDIPQEVIGQMIKFGLSIDKDDLRMVMLPGTFGNVEGVSYWLMSPYLARNVIGELFPDSSLAPSPDATDTPASGSNPYARYRVTVWNATDDEQAGLEVVKRLREAGWNVWSVTRAPSGAPRSRFIAQTGKSELLAELQSSVGYSRAEALTASIGDIASDFTVLIEDDMAHFLRATAKPSAQPVH
ncbi:MAG TPA: LCP family protein [Candidatus Obscuribacterales bacterium]